MIPNEELDRALARWKARSQAVVPEVVRPRPIPLSELGSIPDLAAPQSEIDANELDTYEDK